MLAAIRGATKVCDQSPVGRRHESWLTAAEARVAREYDCGSVYLVPDVIRHGINMITVVRHDHHRFGVVWWSHSPRLWWGLWGWRGGAWGGAPLLCRPTNDMSGTRT